MYFDKRTENLPGAVPVQHPELTAAQQHCLEAAEYLRNHQWLQGVWCDPLWVDLHDGRGGYGHRASLRQKHPSFCRGDPVFMSRQRGE